MLFRSISANLIIQHRKSGNRVEDQSDCDRFGDTKPFVGKEASDVVVEVGSLGVGMQQAMVGAEGNAGVLIHGSVAERYLKEWLGGCRKPPGPVTRIVLLQDSSFATVGGRAFVESQ